MTDFLLSFWREHELSVLAALSVLVTGFVVVHILLFKTNSVSALAWVVLVILFPFLGAAIYWIFGINRVWRDTRSARAPAFSDQGVLPDRVPDDIDRQQPMQQVGTRITGTALRPDNLVEPLVNGEEAFPAMLRAIDSASSEVLLGTFIFDADATGTLFIEALVAAQQRGARVCVLLDDAGRRFSMPTVSRLLRRSGLEHQLFMPLKLLPPSLSINLRNHRKLLVVDQQYGFVGGMNIGDRQLAEGTSRLRTSDLHFSLQGPIVADLRELFEADWSASGGEALAPATRGAPAAAVGSSATRLVADGPDERMDHLALLIAGVVSSAEHRIVLITPYFLPDPRLLGALQNAALRGVSVTVVIPHVCNWPIVRWALNHSLWQLLSVGVEIVEQPAPFAHTKCLLVDDSYALIGSANIDARSLRLNFELGVEVFDPGFTEALHNHALGLMERSTSVLAHRVTDRSLLVRLRDALAGLFSPYL